MICDPGTSVLPAYDPNNARYISRDNTSMIRNLGQSHVPTSRVASRVVQRKCACGSKTGTNGKCDNCRDADLQRKASGSSDVGEVPPKCYDVAGSSGAPGDAEPWKLAEPRFAHDFSRVPIAKESARNRSSFSNNEIDFNSPSDAVAFGVTSLAHRLRQRSSGTALNSNERFRMEQRLGHGLEGVRIHSSDASRAAARLMGARAFTIGKDIYLADRLTTGDDQTQNDILLHELSHAIQQRPWNGSQIELPTANGAAEREATRVADSSRTNMPVEPIAASTYSPTVMTLPGWAWALIAGELACLFGFYIYALKNLWHKGDKYLHCWTSCKIATWCPPVPLVGQAIAAIVGALKELLDIVIGESELRDMANNMSGIECSLHYLDETCDSCCDGKLRRGELAMDGSSSVPSDVSSNVSEESDQFTKAAAVRQTQQFVEPQATSTAGLA
jgi:hypothetical protein